MRNKGEVFRSLGTGGVSGRCPKETCFGSPLLAMAFAVRHGVAARSTRTGALTRAVDDIAPVKSVGVTITIARSADDFHRLSDIP